MSNDIASRLSPQERFEQKVRDKLITDIGDLIPDDVLKVMVEKAMEKAFFEDQIVTPGSYSKNEIRKPAAFVAIVKELMNERMKTAISDWVADNQTAIVEIFEKTIKDGIAATMIDHFDRMLGFYIRDNMGRALKQAFPDRDWSNFHY